jgi:sugar phosphate isomerase/epimerase
MVFWWREHNLSFEQECDFLKALGFGIELWPTMKGHNDCRYDRRNWSRLEEATTDMLVCLNSRHDGPTLHEWKEQIECAQMLKAPIVAKMESLCISDQLGIADWAFATEVVKMAKDHDVMLCIETGALPALLKIGDKFDNVKYCLDTGYANIDPDRDFKEYVDKLAGRTTYLHLTDNYGKLDDHEPPGVKGGMARENWDYLLNALQKTNGEQIIGALEMFPCLPGTMIKHSSNFLFKEMNWPNPPKPQPGHDENTYRPI